MAGKNAIGFGLGLGGLLLVAAAAWISVAFGALPRPLANNVRWVSPTFLLGAQLGISGLISGWLSYEITPRVANGNGIFRVALMTFFATVCTVALAIVFSLIVRPFSMDVVAVYFLLLPLPCLGIVPLWAVTYLQLIRLQEGFSQDAALVRRGDMVRLLAGLRQPGTTSSISSETDDSHSTERLAVPNRRR